MPLYKIFDSTIEAPTPDQAVLSYARSDTSLHSNQEKLQKEYNFYISQQENPPPHLNTFQKALDATQVQVGINKFYPVRNFEILLEEVSEA